MPKPSFEIRRNAAQHYYFVLATAKRGDVFISSAYKTRDAAMAAISDLRSSVGFNNRCQKLMSARREHYFTLWAHSGQVLGTSVMFPSELEREKALRELKRHAPIANIKDDSSPPTAESTLAMSSPAVIGDVGAANGRIIDAD